MSCLRDWSPDVCSSDLRLLCRLGRLVLVIAADLERDRGRVLPAPSVIGPIGEARRAAGVLIDVDLELGSTLDGRDRADVRLISLDADREQVAIGIGVVRSEEHTSEL